MKNDFSRLEEMTYSGRGILVGKTPLGNLFVGYTLTGRSESSQARKLVTGLNKSLVRTDVTDPNQLAKGNVALLLYPAIMDVQGQTLIASNGAQSQLLYNNARNHRDFYPVGILKLSFKEPFWVYDQNSDQLIDLTTFEPDSPNDTPRINAVVNWDRQAMHIVSNDGGIPKHTYFDTLLQRGEGRMITTYGGGNEKPLKPFDASPFGMGIGTDDPQEIAEQLYEAIQGGQNPGDNYAVSVAVKKLGSIDATIINRFEVE